MRRIEPVVGTMIRDGEAQHATVSVLPGSLAATARVAASSALGSGAGVGPTSALGSSVGIAPPSALGVTAGIELQWSTMLADAVTAAEAMLGCVLLRVHRGRIRRARIVETEAYPAGDPASHSFRGRTKRNAVMFARAGLAYVYRIHQVVCLNVVTGPEGQGEAVLIRALEPLSGIDLMERARARNSVGRTRPLGVDVTNGPGKLCQAFDVTLLMDGVDLLQPLSEQTSEMRLESSRQGTTALRRETERPRTSGLFLEFASRDPSARIGRSPRIGISKAREAPLRFYLEGNRWLSRT